MMSYQEISPSITSKSTRQSVYQTNGRPLSEEAIYKAKLKYGIYNNPAKVNLGVDPSASDTAALLASSSDLSIHPYKRELSVDAATAALIAKTDSAPRAWKRNNFAPEAEYAAISAKSQKYPFYDTSSSIEMEDSQDAASAVLRKSSNNIARDALHDLYEFDDIRSGKTTLSQFVHTSSSASPSSRLTYKLDRRSGLTTSHNANEGSRKMNIGQINKLATSNSTKTMTSRTSPTTMDSRSGLTTSNLHLTANGAVDISKINASAQESAKKSMTSRLSSNQTPYGIPTASDLANNSSFASIGALASQNFDPDYDYSAAERATLTKNTLVDSKVLLKAITNANATLTGIDEKRNVENLFGNREMNIKAVQIAQANHAKRQSEQNSGNINLGGGLILSLAEINKMAASIVQPVLSDLDAKAQTQRDVVDERNRQQADLKQKRAQFFADKKAAKIALKQRREAEKQARRAKLQSDKDTVKESQVALFKERDDIVAGREQDLRDKIAEEDAAKQEVETERNDKSAVIANIKAEKDAERQAELDAMQAERDEDVAPLLAELETETEILNQKINTRAAAQTYYVEHKGRFENADEDYEAAVAKLAEIEAKIEITEKNLAKATTDSERETAEAEAALAQSDLDYERLNRETNEFVAVRASLATEREAKEAERLKLLEDLKEAKTSHLEQSREINQIYPEHLQQEIPEEISDEETIDHGKFALNDDEISEPPAIKDDVDYDFGYEQEIELGEDKEKPEAHTETVPKSAKASVPKKTWEEIKASKDFAAGADPLKNIPTSEKPPMASVVTEDEVRKANAKKLAETSVNAETGAPAFKKSTAAAATGTSLTTPSAQEKKEKMGFGKKFMKFMTTEPPRPSKRVPGTKRVSSGSIKPAASVALAAGTTAAPITSAVEAKEAEVAKVKETPAGAVAAAEEEDGGELKTTFSGFSQGSDIEEGKEEPK